MNKSDELKELLITWRRAERAHARAVLVANHPDHIKVLNDEAELALHKIRIFVDSEPWPELQ